MKTVTLLQGQTERRGDSFRTACVSGARFALAIVFTLGPVGFACAQSSGANGQWDNGAHGNQTTAPQLIRGEDSDLFANDQDAVMKERRLRALNIERQKRMVADADKLLALAKELNDEVASANEGSFTAGQLRKIGEIEKLARSVRERMTSGIAETPGLSSPPISAFPIHQ